ncbi:hypothetical protein VPNG_06647 [Cytospora leucostoma]|uniref:C2H2-type domain-containing protein n=1 Tax=Cytospora leucostoma TaxID=1230097 RepID=A0A423WTY8_9PEZI|nr:hypothetical protein VPNG_06647 [Cytospora leucostoma]
MTGPTLITVLRGFKVRTSTLDNFLIANGHPNGIQTGPSPPIYKYDYDNCVATDETSEVLRAKVRAAAASMPSDSGTATNTTGVLLVVPSVEGHTDSAWSYVSYSYAQVYAQRHITAEDPSERVPPGFEELRQEVLGHSSHTDHRDEGLLGLFVVSARERAGMIPAVLRERYKELPIRCDRCEETFNSWSQRQWHRNTIHGTDEELNPMPENA